MIIAATGKLFWTKGKRLLPGYFDYFDSFLLGLQRNLKTGMSKTSIQKLFQSVPPFDFSNTILTRATRESVVLPLEEVVWSDWGRPERVFSTLREISREPRFFLSESA